VSAPETNVSTLAHALLKAMEATCSEHKIRDIEEVLGAYVTAVGWLLAGLEPESREANYLRFGSSLRAAIDMSVEAGHHATIHRVAGSQPQ
jgi:hypothetical protein